MSPYSWFAAERIERVMPGTQWRGVLAGVVFQAHDRVSWGLTERRPGEIAECEARAAARGLGGIRWPDPWPTSDLRIGRAMVYAERAQNGGAAQGLLKPLALAAMRLAFVEGVDLSGEDAVLEAGRRAGIEESELRGALADPDIKQGLRSVTDEALGAGVFGVPTVVIGGELFWGDDRLDDAAAALEV
jgi:2-hydroxychromene-2-carboxylate isomerase